MLHYEFCLHNSKESFYLYLCDPCYVKHLYSDWRYDAITLTHIIATAESVDSSTPESENTLFFCRLASFLSQPLDNIQINQES